MPSTSFLAQFHLSFHLTDLLLVGAAILAGAMNSIAGGGSFVTFPTLIFTGVSPLIANASNTVALFPASFASAWALRREFTQIHEINFKYFFSVCLLGGAIGAWLLLHTPETAFLRLIPYLLLFATMVFVFGKQISAAVRARTQVPLAGALAIQFATAVYGGYFGAGVGIVTLATLTVLGMTEIHKMNAIKNLCVGSLNGIAVVLFVFHGAVDWRSALIMMGGAVFGGFAGTSLAKKVSQASLRKFIGLVGLSLSIYFFLK